MRGCIGFLVIEYDPTLQYVVSCNVFIVWHVRVQAFKNKLSNIRFK